MEPRWAEMHCQTMIISSRNGLWILLIVNVLTNMFYTVSGLNSDGLMLLAFKTAITSDPSQALGNWNSSDQTPCNWTGVRCSEKSEAVVSLSLAKKNLVGTLPPELGNLANLRHINLHTNQLQGLLPNQLFDPPLLKAIYLFQNNLSGTFSSKVGQLANLMHLDVSNNAIEGIIPPEITQNKRLLLLSLHNNQFSGPIPVGLGTHLTQLRRLELSFNQLTGNIPADLGSLSALDATLDLSSNRLSGSIPSSLGNLPGGLELNFSNNELSGDIPGNGIFAQQSPSAFTGNAGLCGAPLNDAACSLPPAPLVPNPAPLNPHRKRSLGHVGIIGVSVASGVALILALIILSYICYFLTRKKSAEKEKSDHANQRVGIGVTEKCGLLCCDGCLSKPHANASSETSEQIQGGQLVALDDHFKFDMEELLTASAYALGRSEKGIIYKVLPEEGELMAVRRLGEGGAKLFAQFQAEVRMIGNIRHPNIVSLRAYYWAVDEKLLVYEFIASGSLASALHGRTRKPPLNWESRLKIAVGTAQGLAYIHEYNQGKKLVHKDIKSSNILLDATMEPRIAEFGLDRLILLAVDSASKPAHYFDDTSAMPASNSKQQGAMGRTDMQPDQPRPKAAYVSPTSCYLPPEAAKNENATQKWDVFSFGVVLLELVTGKSPAIQIANFESDLVTWVRNRLQDDKPLEQIVDTNLGQDIPFSGHEMAEVLQIAMTCVHEAPHRRPGMKEISSLLNLVQTP